MYLMLRPMSPMETLFGTRYGYTELGEAARRRENSLRCCALLAGAGSSGHCLEWPARPRARLQRLQQQLLPQLQLSSSQTSASPAQATSYSVTLAALRRSSRPHATVTRQTSRRSRTRSHSVRL